MEKRQNNNPLERKNGKRTEITPKPTGFPSGSLLQGLPGAFSSPGWTSSTLSLVSRKCSSPLIIFVASSRLAPTVPCPPYAGGPSAEHSVPGGLSAGQSREGELPPSGCWSRCFGCSPGSSWPCGLQVHIAPHQPTPPRPSPQDRSQSITRPACVCAWHCPDTRAGPCMWSQDSFACLHV